jgi:phosphotransferase system enzyme I (PtsP)
LRALRALIKAAKKHNVPVTLCGEMAGRPIEALALIGLGFRSLSMSPASIGPVKTMILSTHAGRVSAHLDALLRKSEHNIRDALNDFAKSEGIEI